MADFVTMLVDMGFDRDQSAKAVEKTGNVGVEPAMEWLLANPSAPVSTSSPVTEGSTGPKSPNGNPNQSGGDGPSTGTETAPGDTPSTDADLTAKSYKCEDCGKLFTNLEMVEFHGAKTNHSNFSESTEEKKPLTAEEKAEQTRKLAELMKQKRVEREAKDKKEEISREKQRIESGKELAEAKRRLQDQEMKEMLEQRRREKIEEKQARDRVKAMIEQDKLARKAKFGGGETSEAPSSTSTAVTAAPTKMETEVETVKKDYKESKLQLRLPNGKTLTQSFGVSEPLASVRLYVELNRDDGVTEPFNLMTNFPRRIFQGEDYDKPLQVLGLVPSAVLMVTKST